MPAALRQFTVDDLDSFPQDGSRYEVLYGVLLVTPQAGLPHQIVAGRLAGKLSAVSRPGAERDLRHEGSLTWQSPGGRTLTVEIPALFRNLQ